VKPPCSPRLMVNKKFPLTRLAVEPIPITISYAKNYTIPGTTFFSSKGVAPPGYLKILKKTRSTNVVYVLKISLWNPPRAPHSAYYVKKKTHLTRFAVTIADCHFLRPKRKNWTEHLFFSKQRCPHLLVVLKITHNPLECVAMSGIVSKVDSGRSSHG